MKRKHPHRQRPLVSANERAADQVLGAIRSCAQRLHTAAWSCDSLAPTLTGFVADLRSGYSTHDLPPEELREASFAAGELTAASQARSPPRACCHGPGDPQLGADRPREVRRTMWTSVGDIGSRYGWPSCR